MWMQLALVLALVGGQPEPSSWDRGDALAAEGKHDEAVVEYARAWDEIGSPPILYSWAQSERLRGRCPDAIGLYERFLEQGEAPPAEYDTDELRAQWANMRDNAERQLASCREAVVERPEPPPPEVTSTPPTKSEVDRPPTPKVRWQRDPAGWALVGTGLGAIAAGSVLLGVAAWRSDAAEGRGNHQAFRDAITRARLEQNVGFAVLAVGGALVVGGIVRLAVVARRKVVAPRMMLSSIRRGSR